MSDNRWQGADLLKNGMLVCEIIDIPLELQVGVPGPHKNDIYANYLNYAIKFIINSVKI